MTFIWSKGIEILPQCGITANNKVNLFLTFRMLALMPDAGQNLSVLKSPMRFQHWFLQWIWCFLCTPYDNIVSRVTCLLFVLLIISLARISLFYVTFGFHQNVTQHKVKPNIQGVGLCILLSCIRLALLGDSSGMFALYNWRVVLWREGMAAGMVGFLL